MSANTEHLRAVGRAATEGPWEAVAGAFGDPGNGPDHMRVVTAGWSSAYDEEHTVARLEYDQTGGADATFIATARNEWDGLLDEVEALRAKVARVEELLSAWEGFHSHLGIERGNWGPSSRDLRAALADEGAQDGLSRAGTTSMASGATGDVTGAQIGAQDEGGKA